MLNFTNVTRGSGQDKIWSLLNFTNDTASEGSSPETATTGFSDTLALFLVIIFTTVVVVSFLLYGLVFFTILSNKPFHTSGYLLMITLGVGEMSVAILIVIVPVIYQYILGYEFTTSVNRLIGTLAVYAYTTVQLQYFLVACNRYVAVVHFAKYKTMFSMKLTKIYVTMVFLVFAPLMNIPFITQWACYKYLPEWISHTYDFTCPGTIAIMVLIQCINICVIIFKVYCYGSIIQRLKRTRQAIREKDSSVMNKDEFFLTIQFTIITVMFVVTVIFISIFWFRQYGLFHFKQTVFAVFTNLFCIVNFTANPFIYILINQRLRNAIDHLVRCKPYISTGSSGAEMILQQRNSSVASLGV